MKKNTKIVLIALLCAVIAAVAVFLIVRGIKSAPQDPSSTEAANPTRTGASDSDLLPMLTYEVTYPEPTEDDFETLGAHYAFNYLYVIGNSFFDHAAGEGYRCTVDFDSAKLDSASAACYALYYHGVSPLYEYLFNDDVQLVFNENGEPSTDEPFPEGYDQRYTEEHMQFIAQYVLNMEQPFDRAAFLTAGGEYNVSAVHENGYYYFTVPAIEYDFGFPARIKEMKALDDHKYQFTVEYISGAYTPDTAMEGEGTLVAALKEVDGKRFWSIYSYHADVRTGELPENRPVYKNTADEKADLYGDHASDAVVVGAVQPGESILVYGLYQNDGVSWGKTLKDGVSGWVRLDAVSAVTFPEEPGSADDMNKLWKTLKGIWNTADQREFVEFGLKDNGAPAFTTCIWYSDNGYTADVDAYAAGSESDQVRLQITSHIFNGEDFYDEESVLYLDLSGIDQGVIRMNTKGDANGWIAYHYAGATAEEARPLESE